MHSPTLESVVLCVACVFCGKLYSECHEHEGEATTALLVEGATQASVMEELRPNMAILLVSPDMKMKIEGRQ